MATYTKQLLSESVNGKPISLLTTYAGYGSPILYPAVTKIIHTTPASATSLDEVWIYAHSLGATGTYMQLTFGGTNNPADVIWSGTVDRLVAAEPILICPGLLARGNGSAGFSIYAKIFDANGGASVSLFGYVNRIS